MSKVIDCDFKDVISEKYLSYALSTIMSRSLPDVRDGLKPVHRRLLYAMLQLKLGHDNAYKKCARVVGDVIGKYHPHGEVAVYDTLVRLAQDFTIRYPLIDGQGNFGSIDGDNAAAMRYTESRLTKIASYMMRDIEKDTVDFRLTYDNSDSEPVVLPACFPNILANGSEGIAVGMATSIPSHNLVELLHALSAMIKNPDITVSELANIVIGPDFATGGIVTETRETLHNIYATGRGSVRMRARWHKEDLSHGMYQLVITEIPFQVQKSKLIENIATLLHDKKLLLIGNIRDESTSSIRIVIEPKNRGCDGSMIMESLFKQTDLESRFSYNMNVLRSNSIPEVLNLREMLLEFLNHRITVIHRRSAYDVARINNRLEVLSGLSVVYLNLDEIIHIIRNDDHPKTRLMERFNLTEVQVEAILNMRLRSLQKLDEIAIQTESKELVDQKVELERILADKKHCMKVIDGEFVAILKDISKDESFARRTTIDGNEPEKIEIAITAAIERESITLICSKFGWLHSVKGHISDVTSLKFREGDEMRFMIHCETIDSILIFTTSGRCYTVLADNIAKGRGGTKSSGDAVKMLIDMEDSDEIVNIMKYTPGVNVFFASSVSKGMVVPFDELLSHTKLGKQLMVLPNDSKCVAVLPIVDGVDMVACINSGRKILIFDISDVSQMRKGQGVILQKLHGNEVLTDVQLFDSKVGFSWISKGGVRKTQANIAAWKGRRGGIGKIPPLGFVHNNKFR